MALSEIEKLERRYAENPQGLTFAPLAEVHRKNGDVARALELLRAGLTLHPDYIPASIVLGRCHLDLGDLPAAESAFAHVLSLDGENVIALKALADIAERQYRFDEAERRLRTLLTIDRSNDEARDQLGRVEASHRQAETASSASPDAAAAMAPDESASPGAEPEPADAVSAGGTLEEIVSASAEADAAGLPLLPEPPREAVLAWVEELGGDPSGEPAPLQLEELDLNEAEASPPEGMEVEQPVALEEPVEPLSGLVGRDEALPPADSPGLGTSFQVETAEDIVLQSSGGSEFQVANASEELLSFRRTGDPDPLMQEKPAIEAESAVEPAASGTEDTPESAQPESVPAEAAWAEASSDAAAEAEAPPDGAPAAEDAPAAEEMWESHAHAAEEPAAARATPDAWAPPTAESPSRAEPDLVVTESMAELLLRQGHPAEALVVYRHLEQRTGDPRFKERVAELERMSAPPAAEPAPAPAAEAAPQSPAAEPAPSAPAPSYSIRQTGGRSVQEFLSGVLASRLPPPAAHHAEPSRPAAEAASEGAPTRPAHDSLSLSSVFGEESTPTPPAVPAGNAAAPQGGVSYDEFFGASGPAGTPRPRAGDGKGDDLDQFHAWLQNLKR